MRKKSEIPDVPLREKATVTNDGPKGRERICNAGCITS